MNRLTRRLASVMLVSAMVVTQPGMSFASVRSTVAEDVTKETIVEASDITSDAVENESEPKNEEVVISDEISQEEVLTEDLIEEEAVETTILGETDGNAGDDNEGDVEAENYYASGYTPYYPTKVSIVCGDKENQKITLCGDSDSEELSSSAEVELKFYGEDTPEAMEKIENPTDVIWEPRNSSIIDVEQTHTTSTTITIKEDEETENIKTGSQTVYAKLKYVSPFETKEIRTVSITVTVVKAGQISRVAITEGDKVITKTELIWGGNDDEDNKKLSTKIVSPTAYYNFDEEGDWSSNSPYVDVSDGEISLTSDCDDVFENTNKKSINARVSHTGYYYKENGNIARKVVSTVNVTVKKADIEPILEKNSFYINKYSTISNEVDYTGDTFRIIPKYGKDIEADGIEVFTTNNKLLEEFGVVANDDTEDPYDYYIFLKDEYRDDYTASKSIPAKLLVPYGTERPKVYSIKISVGVTEPKISMVQKAVMNLAKIDDIRGEYTVKASYGKIESIQAVFVDKYNKIICDEDGNPLRPYSTRPTYDVEYPAVKKAEKAELEFKDYSSMYIYPYEHFYGEFAPAEDADKEDRYNDTGYNYIKEEIDNYKNIKKIKILITFKGKFDEESEEVKVTDTYKTEWKYKYKLLDIAVNSVLNMPTGTTFDYECTPDMIERHEIPDGSNHRYEYVLNSRVTAYDSNGYYDPEYATYVTSDPYLRYPDGKDRLDCVKDELTKVTQIPVIWNFGNRSVGDSRTITLRLYNKHWAVPIDVKHRLKLLPNNLPKTKFSASKVTIRNDGSDTAAITIYGPNGVNYDGFTKPVINLRPSEDVDRNSNPIEFFNPYNANELEKTKSEDGQFNSKVYITANADAKEGKTIKPGTYKYSFGGYVINDNNADGINNIAYSEVNQITVVVIDAKKSNITTKMTSAGSINTVNRYDDEQYLMRKGSSLLLKPLFTNSTRAYMNDPADVILKEVKWYGRTVSGNYVNEKRDYEAPEPDEESKIISKADYNGYKERIYDDAVTNGFPLFAHYDKDLDKVIVEAIPGVAINTECTYELKFGVCSRDQYCKVTNEYKEADDKDEEGYIYSEAFAAEHPYAQFGANYAEYTIKIKIQENIPALKTNKQRVTLYTASPLLTQKFEIFDTTNVVHKYINSVEVDSVTGPSLPASVNKEISKEYFDIEFKPATMFYFANADNQPNADDYKNIVTIKINAEKAKELLPGSYKVKFNIMCEDKAVNTSSKQVILSVDLK